jgi:serine/threonine protein kinase
MLGVCFACGQTLELGRYCPECGAEQVARPNPEDPLLGRVIAERYEIIELVNVGGMGSVYRARHRALDRPVAIKFIHPHLLTAEDVVTRFMIEAQTASRINHPNVVSIYDFGRTSTEDGGRPFLVMELVAGADLATVSQREGLLPIPRILRILREVLLALAEAHRVGVVHRDVKPENIVLEPRKGGESVKVVDFGIALRARTGRRVTEEGRVMGTPVYMAPEQATGETVGPSADLYAAGVILFQLLTGHLPFDGPDADSILAQHRGAPRVDPRVVAPMRGIGEPLAQLSRRAIDVDPKLRWASADDFIAALDEVALATGAIPTPRSSQSSLFHAVPATLPSARATTASSELDPYGVIEPPPPTRPPHLAGRDEELAWLDAQVLAPPASRIIALWGHEGSGRSALVSCLASLARARGDVAHVLVGPPHPFDELSYRGLRTLVATLLPERTMESLGAGEGPGDELTRTGLREIFAPRLGRVTGEPHDVRRRAVAALAWAVADASSRAERLLICLDDIDSFDRLSQRTFGDYLALGPAQGAVFVVTSERSPETWLHASARSMELAGIPGDAAAALANEPALAECDGIEPLFAMEARRFRATYGAEPLPRNLGELVLARLRALPRFALDVLEALAVLGRGRTAELSRLLSRPNDVPASLSFLESQGLVRCRGGLWETSHRLHARLAKSLAPRGVLEERHARAAELLAENGSSLELSAYHSVRGRPDFASYLLIDDCARLRLEHGDEDGAIAMLWDGLHAAHREALLGEPDATDAWIAFGKKLGAALLNASRGDEAMGVLNEVLDQAGAEDLERARVLAQLGDVAAHRNRHAMALSRRREALGIALRLGDATLVNTLRRSISPAPGDEPSPTGRSR